MFIIDRFEEEWAVISNDGQTFNIPRQILPREVGEGDVIKISIEVDRTATKERTSSVKKLIDELFQD